MDSPWWIPHEVTKIHRPRYGSAPFRRTTIGSLWTATPWRSSVEWPLWLTSPQVMRKSGTWPGIFVCWEILRERFLSWLQDVTRCCPQNISVRLRLSDGFVHRLCSHRGWSFEAANISRAVVSRPQTELYSFPAWYLQSKCWKKAFGNCLFLHFHDMLEDCFLLLLIALKKLVPPDPVYDHFPVISDYNFCVYPIFNIFRQPHYCYISPFLLIESYQIHHIAHISLSIPIMIAFALSPHN